jgi:hypothetical protein
MIILDRKDAFAPEIERITYHRRFEGAITHRVRRIAEFAFSVESHKNPMVQLSDLVVYCTKKFCEMEGGYRPDWGEEARRFYAKCFSVIHARLSRPSLVSRREPATRALNSFLSRVRAVPKARWKNRYGLPGEARQPDPRTEQGISVVGM